MTRWSEAPPAPVPPPRHRALDVLAFGWIALAGPLARAWALPASLPQQVGSVGLVAAIAIAFVPTRAWWGRLLVAGAAGAVLMPTQGQTIALWIAVGLVLATWVVQERPPLPFLPAPGEGATAPTVVLTGLAAWLGLKEANTWQPLVPLAIAVAMPVLVRLGGGMLHRATKRFGDAVGNAVSFVLFGLLSAVSILVPWVFQRLLRIDPLHPRRGWVARDRRPLRPTEPWATDPAAVPLPARVRLRGTIAVTLVGLLVVGYVVVDRVTNQERRGDGASSSTLLGVDKVAATGKVPPAQAGNDWYGQYQKDIAWVTDEKVALHPFDMYRLWDAKTRTVNVRDRHRVSWKPPACSCRRLTVWLYGGGGAFGFEQRDEHTIASELARLAADDGLTVDVVNRGLPGQLHWRTSTRLAWDLATAERRPDLVLFYEGAEEVEGAEALRERGDVRRPYEPLMEDLWDEIQDAKGPIDQPEPRIGVKLIGDPPIPALTPAQVGRLAVTRYVRTLDTSDTYARQHDVPVRYFWQPTRYTRPEAERASADPKVDARRKAEFAAARRALPKDRVTDLSNVFRGIDDPLFVDSVHTNEEGARLVAEAIYRSVADELRQAEDRKAGS